MRILIVHNYYQQRGGEDESTENEVRLLEKNGHTVQFYSRHNNEIQTFSLWRKFKLLGEPTWSRRTFREICEIVGEFRPEIVHVQNFFRVKIDGGNACGSPDLRRLPQFSSPNPCSGHRGRRSSLDNITPSQYLEEQEIRERGISLMLAYTIMG